MRKLIGNKLKALRLKKKLSLTELGDLLGIDRQYVWRIENGKINITIDYLNKIVKKLNCKDEDF